MSNFFKRDNIFYENPIYCSDIGSGGAENVLFNVLKTWNKKDVTLISLTNIGFMVKIRM